MRITFRPADLLSLYFIALLSVLTVFFLPLPAWGRLLGTYGLLALAVASLAVLEKRHGRSGRLSSLRPAAYVVIILVIFNSLGDLIPAVWPRTFDDVLIRIDFALFGVHPTLWLEKTIHPALTAALQLAYISYYFIPLSLGALLVVKGRERELEESLFGIVLCFYLSYVGYLLVPAVGPRFTLAHLQTAGLQAGPVTQAVQGALNGLEHNKTDAFPSGHTAVALVTLFYAGKCREKALFRILIPIVSSLILSTVYLRYHYVIDVLAGAMLAALTILISPHVERLLSPRKPLG